jgi:hypothetical protein
LRRGIGTDDHVEQYRRIALAAENNPDRFGDIGRRQCRVDRYLCKAARHHEPAKAGADEHDSQAITCHDWYDDSPNIVGRVELSATHHCSRRWDSIGEKLVR